MAHRAALFFVSLALSQTSAYTAKTWVCAVHHNYGVLVYMPAFAGTHCAYPQRNGQAELTWVVGYIPRRVTCPQMVTHATTNWA